MCVAIINQTISFTHSLIYSFDVFLNSVFGGFSFFSSVYCCRFYRVFLCLSVSVSLFISLSPSFISPFRFKLFMLLLLLLLLVYVWSRQFTTKHVYVCATNASSAMVIIGECILSIHTHKPFYMKDTYKKSRTHIVAYTHAPLHVKQYTMNVDRFNEYCSAYNIKWALISHYIIKLASHQLQFFSLFSTLHFIFKLCCRFFPISFIIFSLCYSTLTLNIHILIRTEEKKKKFNRNEYRNAIISNREKGKKKDRKKTQSFTHRHSFESVWIKHTQQL